MLMKEDEKKFILAVYNRGDKRVRQVIKDLSDTMHYKRCWYLLEKWVNKDFYSYGVCLDNGWLTDEGKKFAEGILLNVN